MSVKENFLIEKSNILNELRSNSMTLQELRFFSIYLAKINPRDINTRFVKFKLSDFQKIMDFGKLNIGQINASTDNLLSKIIKIPKSNGGFEKFQLFKKCVLDINEDNEWYIEICAHDEALPLMFELKNKYFSYQLWNALKLKSSNQLRMYEILKQYEKIGERNLSIEELKELIGISKDEYKLFNNFKKDVLEVCKKALEENTDIRFTYEPTGKKGRGGKILKLKFKIFKNKYYKDPLTLEDFIDSRDIPFDGEFEEKKEKKKTPYEKNIEYMSDACDNEFSFDEMVILWGFIIKILPVEKFANERFDYLYRKYNEFSYTAKKNNVKKRFAYFRKIIEADYKEFYPI